MKDIEIIVNASGIVAVNLWFTCPDEEVEAVLFLEKISAGLDALDAIAKLPEFPTHSLSFDMIERLIKRKCAEAQAKL
jgi:hypothetical protein